VSADPLDGGRLAGLGNLSCAYRGRLLRSGEYALERGV
jgi:hypothetical protein